MCPNTPHKTSVNAITFQMKFSFPLIVIFLPLLYVPLPYTLSTDRSIALKIDLSL